MARVFRHTYTAKTKGGERVKRTCRKWYIEYTDASGRARRVPGYTDKRATEHKASEIQRGVEREKAGIVDTESVNLSRELTAPVEVHVSAHRTHLQASDVSPWYLSETSRRLRRMLKDCEFGRLADIRAEAVQRWVTLRRTENMGAATISLYVGSLRSFIRWCIADGRMSSDPLVTLKRIEQPADMQRRNRRALTDDELVRLLRVAELRPIAEFGRQRVQKPKSEQTGKRDTWQRGELSPENLAECLERGRMALRRKYEYARGLERLGRERRLIYMTLVLTGLRRGELEAMTWADL